MKRYLLLLCIFLKHTFASLLHPINLYDDDASKNYLYERACHHYSSELSTARYESPQVRSKVLDSLYLKCLTVIWPNCEVMSANNMIVSLTHYETFENGQVIVHNINRKPVKYAHSRGFFAENLLEPDHRRFIFWDPLAPMTDLHKFDAIKFASVQTLYMTHLTDTAKAIKKFRGAGTESSNHLYLKESLSPDNYSLAMDFETLRKFVKLSIRMIEGSGLLPRLSQGVTSDLHALLKNSIPNGSVLLTVFKKSSPGEHIRLLYPLYTAINPSFPIAIHYVPLAMAPISYTRDLTCRSFIAAAFDEEGMLLNEPIKEVASYLVVSFNSIKVEWTI